MASFAAVLFLTVALLVATAPRHRAASLRGHQGRSPHRIAGASSGGGRAAAGVDDVVHAVVHGDDPVHGLLHGRGREGALGVVLQGPPGARRRRAHLPLPRHERRHRQPHAREHRLQPRRRPPVHLRRRVADGSTLQLRK